ncbi:shikimate kinase, partial [Pseudomonas syringae]
MRNLILVGPMGAGKSTIGRLRAKELRLPFKDCGQGIELRTGANIPRIRDEEREPGFRDREHARRGRLCESAGAARSPRRGAGARAEQHH